MLVMLPSPIAASGVSPSPIWEREGARPAQPGGKGEDIWQNEGRY